MSRKDEFGVFYLITSIRGEEGGLLFEPYPMTPASVMLAETVYRKIRESGTDQPGSPWSSTNRAGVLGSRDRAQSASALPRHASVKVSAGVRCCYSSSSLCWAELSPFEPPVDLVGVGVPPLAQAVLETR